MHAVVEEVVASSSDYTPMVLNYCDGFDEVDGYPGLSVIKLLEAKDIIFTGANSNFEYLTISPIRMKQALLESGVCTAPYEVISDLSKIGGICEKLGTHLVVKPAISHSGIGLSSNSVIRSDKEIYQQTQYFVKKQNFSIYSGQCFCRKLYQWA
jgi:D-alanine-D-alanine ligase-like ATP-grasp enzyme